MLSGGLLIDVAGWVLEGRLYIDICKVLAYKFEFL
jgi:hypothetical protein